METVESMYKGRNMQNQMGDQRADLLGSNLSKIQNAVVKEAQDSVGNIATKQDVGAVGS